MLLLKKPRPHTLEINSWSKQQGLITEARRIAAYTLFRLCSCITNYHKTSLECISTNWSPMRFLFYLKLSSNTNKVSVALLEKEGQVLKYVDIEWDFYLAFQNPLMSHFHFPIGVKSLILGRPAKRSFVAARNFGLCGLWSCA